MRAEVVQIASAEYGYHAAGRPYLAFEQSIPSLPPGREKAPLSDEDRAIAGELGWEAPPATYGRYRVAVSADGSGDEAFSICAESDLDGDGRVAATVLFHPGSTAAVAPPPAPCSGAVVPGERSVAMAADDPADQPIAISPGDVF